MSLLYMHHARWTVVVDVSPIHGAPTTLAQRLRKMGYESARVGEKDGLTVVEMEVK